MNFRYPLIAAVILAVSACGAASQGRNPTAISSASASLWIKAESKPVVLDVRTSGEFADGHINGAKLIPWTDRDFETRASKELDRSKPVLVYCRSGARSTAAAKKLASLGFTDVRNLEGGTLAWKKEGLPLTPSN